jgi:hypothetical protein
MRIAIISAPRTGSTKLSAVLSSMFNLKNFNEQLNEVIPAAGFLKKFQVNKVMSQDDFVVKIFPGAQVHIDWNDFDLIVSTSRESEIDNFLSHYVASERNLWIPYEGQSWQELNKFTVDLKHVKRWGYWYYEEFKERILPIIGKNVVNFSYEEICDDEKLLHKIRMLGIPIENQDPVIRSRSTGINYKEKCLNYKDVVKAISNEKKKKIEDAKAMKKAKDIEEHWKMIDEKNRLDWEDLDRHGKSLDEKYERKWSKLKSNKVTYKNSINNLQTVYKLRSIRLKKNKSWMTMFRMKREIVKLQFLQKANVSSLNINSIKVSQIIEWKMFIIQGKLIRFKQYARHKIFSLKLLINKTIGAVNEAIVQKIFDVTSSF